MNYLEDIEVEGREISRWILKMQVGRVWIRFNSKSTEIDTVAINTILLLYMLRGFDHMFRPLVSEIFKSFT